MGDQALSELTIVMAVYGQPQMLAHQLNAIAGYGESVCRHLNLIVVDDCGAPAVEIREIELVASQLKSAMLLRVTQDIPWNQMGARNLGMHHAKGWCVMLDPDMVFDGKTMARLIHAASLMHRGQVVRFGLKHVNSGKLDMSSPNTWLLHRDDFFDVGGYDEDFAGNKGWSDVQLLNIMHSCYKVTMRPDLHADFHSTTTIPDAMVTKLDRSVAANKQKHIRKIGEAKQAGGWARWAKSRRNVPRLRFSWIQLYPSL